MDATRTAHAALTLSIDWSAMTARLDVGGQSHTLTIWLDTGVPASAGPGGTTTAPYVDDLPAWTTPEQDAEIDRLVADAWERECSDASDDAQLARVA